MLHYTYITCLVVGEVALGLTIIIVCPRATSQKYSDNYQSTAFLWQYHSAIVAYSSSSTRCSYQDKQTIPENLQVQQFCTGSPVFWTEKCPHELQTPKTPVCPF